MIEIFSYWIFIWFLFYLFGIVKQNPLYILIVAYIITFFELLYIFYKKASKYNLIKFIIINVIIKIIPIFIIILFYSTIFNIYDIYYGLIIFIFYLIIMIIFNKNPYKFYINVLNTYIYDNKNGYKSFISKFYDYIIKNYIK